MLYLGQSFNIYSLVYLFAPICSFSETLSYHSRARLTVFCTGLGLSRFAHLLTILPHHFFQVTLSVLQISFQIKTFRTALSSFFLDCIPFACKSQIGFIFPLWHNKTALHCNSYIFVSRDCNLRAENIYHLLLNPKKLLAQIFIHRKQFNITDNNF